MFSVPNLKPLFSWLKTTYSEADGNGSSTRVHIAAIIAFTLGVGVSFAASVHHKLVTIDQFDAFLGSAASFITATCGALYAINKAGAYLDGKNENDKKDGN